MRLKPDDPDIVIRQIEPGIVLAWKVCRLAVIHIRGIERGNFA